MSPEEREERSALFRVLKDYTGDNYIDLNKVLTSIGTDFYTPNWARGWHESKVRSECL